MKVPLSMILTWTLVCLMTVFSTAVGIYKAKHRPKRVDPWNSYEGKFIRYVRSFHGDPRVAVLYDAYGAPHYYDMKEREITVQQAKKIINERRSTR